MTSTLTPDDAMPLHVRAAELGIPPEDVEVFVSAANRARGLDRDDRFDMVRMWLAAGSVVGAYRAMLGSWANPVPGWSPSLRTVTGTAMPHAAATPGADGQVETHAGPVDIVADGRHAAPVLWCHRGAALGELVAYRRGARGPDSLDVWLTLDHSPRASDVLDLIDCGRVGLSVGVASPAALGTGQRSSRIIERQRLREVSLVPIERAAFGEATRVQRGTAPARLVEQYRDARAWAQSSTTPRVPTHRVRAATATSAPVYYH